jgi:hypothetical protein
MRGQRSKAVMGTISGRRFKADVSREEVIYENQVATDRANLMLGHIGEQQEIKELPIQIFCDGAKDCQATYFEGEPSLGWRSVGGLDWCADCQMLGFAPGGIGQA